MLAKFVWTVVEHATDGYSKKQVQQTVSLTLTSKLTEPVRENWDFDLGKADQDYINKNELTRIHWECDEAIISDAQMGGFVMQQVKKKQSLHFNSVDKEMLMHVYVDCALFLWVIWSHKVSLLTRFYIS